MRWIAPLVGPVVSLVATVGVATAGTRHTLDVFKAAVTNTHHVSTTENVVGSGGGPVYTHSGDSKRDPHCLSKSCRKIWPWVTIANGKTLTESSLIKEKLGVWKHNGVSQLTLGGHPLFFYVGDRPTKHQARGEGIVSFGGTWHVWKISSPPQGGGPTTTGPTFLGSSFSGSQPDTEDLAVSPKAQINGIELSTTSGSKITVHSPPPGGTCRDPAINTIKCTFPPVSEPFTMSINFFTPTFAGLMGAVSSDGGKTWGPTSTFTHQGP